MTDRITTFSREGLAFDVRDDGPTDAPVAILLHGFPQDSSSWDAIAPRLNAAGLRTLAPDQRGYSPGARPPRVDDYQMEQLVADVLALADAAGAERFHLVGHDWGGGVAWSVAASVPERLASLTVLSTPHPAAMARALRSPSQLRKSWYMGAVQVPRVPELALAGRIPRMLTSAGLEPAIANRYDDRFATPESLRGPINWYRAMARHRGSLSTGTVSVPTTFVWGNRDVALGRTAAEATAEHVTGDYRFVELDATHWLPEMNADEVCDAMLQRILPQP